MANYASTALLAARVKQKEQYYRKFDGRPQGSFLMDMFKKSSNVMEMDISEIRQANTQTTSMIYPVKSLRTIGSAKSCTITGSLEDSGSVDLTWYTKTVEVLISEKRHKGNEYKMIDTLARELLDAEIDLWKNGAASMEVALLAYLEANRTQTADSVGVHGTWDAVNFLYTYPLADIDIFYNKVVDDLKMNDYSGEILEAFNTSWGHRIRYQANQGEANATNLKYNYNLPLGFSGFESNIITMGTSDGSTHYFVPDGGITIFDWNDPLNREGKVSGEKEWGLYESRFFPGLMLDIFMTTECADTSETGGDVQDFVKKYQLAYNYAIAKAPFHTAGETPIIKAAILTT